MFRRFIREFIEQSPRLKQKDFPDNYNQLRKKVGQDLTDARTLMTLHSPTMGAFGGTAHFLYGDRLRFDFNNERIVYVPKHSFPVEYREAMCIVLAENLIRLHGRRTVFNHFYHTGSRRVAQKWF